MGGEGFTGADGVLCFLLGGWGGPGGVALLGLVAPGDHVLGDLVVTGVFTGR